MDSIHIRKYPRTRHTEGSGLQKGDHDLETFPIADLTDKPLVIKEKLDGTNAGIDFLSLRGSRQPHSTYRGTRRIGPFVRTASLPRSVPTSAHRQCASKMPPTIGSPVCASMMPKS